MKTMSKTLGVVLVRFGSLFLIAWVIMLVVGNAHKEYAGFPDINYFAAVWLAMGATVVYWTIEGADSWVNYIRGETKEIHVSLTKAKDD